MERILLVSTGNPKDKRVWSGIEHSIYQQLMRHYEVDVLTVNIKWTKRLDKLRMRLLTLGKQSSSFGFLDSYISSKKVQKKLKTGEYDAAFVFGSTNLAFVRANTPIVYYTDATTHVMQDYYWKYQRILQWEANIIQGKCLKNSSINLAASTWALNDMVNYFKIDKPKCMLCRFGANAQVKDEASSKTKGTIDILFVGADWKRKGGEIAIEALQQLKTMDADRQYKLHVVGGKPKDAENRDDIIFYGFLDRNNPEQEALHTKLFQESDIFLLPTKAECAGIVFCEASAYGIPIVTHDTGGISDYVINDFNGFRLPIGASGKEFAETILNIANNPSLKEKLSENGKKFYTESLNWNACGQTIHHIISQLISGKNMK